MRLLSLDSDGTLTWAEFAADRLPPYAILSHTWEAEEVIFTNLIDGHAHSKGVPQNRVLRGAGSS
jgi:hypothetical protein